MKSGSGGSTKSTAYSSWVNHLFPDHQLTLTVAHQSPHHTNRGFKAGSLFDPSDVQRRVLARHWRSMSATESESSIYPVAHEISFGNRHTQADMGMTSADRDPQRNCHWCYSANERDHDPPLPPPPPPHHHHHHYVGSLTKDLVVKDQPHETSTCRQVEDEDKEEEKEVETKAPAIPSSSYITMVEDTQAQELIKEITTVELEVAKLEKHLLLLYRNTFLRNSFDPPNNYMHTHEDRTSTASPKTALQLCIPPEPSSNRISLALGRKKETPIYGGPPNDSCMDSNSCSDTNVPFWNSLDSQAEVPSSPCYSSENSCNLCSLHSQPLSSTITPGNEAWFPEGGSKGTVPFFNTTKGKPYGDAYSRCLKINKLNIANSDKKTIFFAQRANKLSEDLVQCMVAIYCRLAETPPPLLLDNDHQHHGSTTSHCSSATASTSDCAASNIFSAQSFPSGHGAANLQHIKADGTHCDDRSSSDGPKFVHECNVDASDSASSTFEVRCIRFDSERLSFVAEMLGTLRSLVQQLEGVDPGLMTHEQKLAFWINIHNALIMHAFLAFGIPHIRSRGILTSSSSLHHQRAAYKIGKQSIDAQSIQQRILKCKPRRRHHRTVEWLQSFDLLSPKRRRGSRTSWSWSFTIKRPEPLLYFALCCGGRSDPSVRIYREHSIYQDLEMAKQDFLHAHFEGMQQQPPDGRFMLPAILESFAKDTCMKPAQLLEWILENLESKTARSIPLHSLRGDPRADRRIAWSQYDSTFCYVFLASLCK